MRVRRSRTTSVSRQPGKDVRRWRVCFSRIIEGEGELQEIGEAALLGRQEDYGTQNEKTELKRRRTFDQRGGQKGRAAQKAGLLRDQEKLLGEKAQGEGLPGKSLKIGAYLEVTRE